ncbi:protein RALF-like 32 [Dorcoceras hygrometricum]|uniref:Protein RALF-like 32 n=1 Tax=Dorcoceras hygrometricum TaxID=472368 RepID=A0A2Z7AR86_9LAMI|nr:protein RALF-like 32 [Dorcoceras hygrometricum]
MGKGCTKFLVCFPILLFVYTDFIINPVTASCNGSTSQSNYEEIETLMESEISRRVLEEKKYISPGAMAKDQPVCNGGERGDPYTRSSGCLPPPSNPYSRGCSRYYRCRSDA